MRGEISVDFLSCRIGTIVTGAIGLVANTIVMVLIITGKLKNVREMRFIVSLCAGDMVFSLIMTTNVSRTSSRTSEKQSESAAFVSLVLHCLILASTFMRQGHLWVITYERLYAARHPFKYKMVFAKAAKNKMLAVVWSAPYLLALLIGIICVLTRDPQLLFHAGAAGIIITFIGMTCMYSMINIIRRRARIHVSRTVHVGARNSQHRSQMTLHNERERNLTRTSIGIVLTYFILNTPIVTFLFASDIRHLTCEDPLGVGLNAALMISCLNSSTDPLIYVWHMLRQQKRRQTAIINEN